MGEVCTRACGFCSIQSGKPRALDPPGAQGNRRAGGGAQPALSSWLTSVNRDDLPDGGATHFANTILAIHRRNPGVAVEVLVPDFMGRPGRRGPASWPPAPPVFNHNTETVAQPVP